MTSNQNQPATKTIRALHRGLQIIELLSQRGQMTLADLRKASGLSNPTLLRVLLTLQDRGWVRRNIVEGRYELSHSLGDILGQDNRAHPLAELSAPYLLDLKKRQVGWPSEICALKGPGRLEIVESTRQRGPMALTRTALGIRPSMVMSAHGRAILAFSNDDQVLKHLQCIRKTGSKEDVLRMESGDFAKEITSTRSRGYGLREAKFWHPPIDPGPELAALAVPILSNSGIHGSISLVWMADEMTLNEVISLGSLQVIQKTSAKIGAALDKASIIAPAI